MLGQGWPAEGDQDALQRLAKRSKCCCAHSQASAGYLSQTGFKIAFRNSTTPVQLQHRQETESTPHTSCSLID